MINRRAFMQGTAVFALAGLVRPVFAAETAIPIVFVHGDSDAGAVWQSTMWRFESNGYPRELLAAISFIDPQARSDDSVPQPSRSSTKDELRQLGAFVDAVRAKTGAAKVALVGNSRGGYSIRNYIANGGAGAVSHAVLCGTPNHGVFAFDALLGSEYNGKGPFLSGLNAGPSEVTPGVAFLTLRSDGYDLYAQPDGAYIGSPGTPTGVTAEGPELKGATNLILGRVDHRETAFSPRAFAEIYKFIVGAAPTRIAITPEAIVTLNGAVTGMAGETPTNRPIAGAKVEIYAVDADTGERKGAALLTKTTQADGVWGPLQTDSATPLEFVITIADSPITHIYRSPFPRSLDILKLTPSEPLSIDDSKVGAVIRMNRPRGYFGVPRDIVLLDGQLPAGLPAGVPGSWHAKMTLASMEDRPIVAEFNQERIVVRPWPVKDNHVTIAELTY